uniref:Uncharacterized protein F13E9.13, mitochondrial n=1 Tax=Culex pipiens TaxID=7175 RepID=A0A8D8E5B1_CULPI
MLSRFKQLFSQKFPIIGMIHVGALPGTPLYSGDFDETVKKAVREAEIYAENGIDGLMIENMHDVPYVQSRHLGPETVACMTRLATSVREATRRAAIPCGVQILACGNREALAVAKAAGLDFIRAEGYVFGHVADEGYTDANAGLVLRYRKAIDAERVLVLTDIKKKHSSHAITEDVSLVDTAKAAEFFISDGLILTGSSTGSETSVEEVQSLRNKTRLPLIIGSGVSVENIDRYWNAADAAIVGSHFKDGGNWQNELSGSRVDALMKKLAGIRN